jgi:hypothetical protein
VADYFRRGAEGRRASAHYCVDSNSIVQCVQTRDVAFGAPGANRNGIHIEMAGYSEQSSSDWRDPYSVAMTKNVAYLVGLVLAPKYKLPIHYCDAVDIRRGVEDHTIRGITTHLQVTKSHVGDGTHTDPGLNFPMDMFLDFVRAAIKGNLA